MKYIIYGLIFISITLNIILYKEWDISSRRSVRFEKLSKEFQRQVTE